MKQFIYILFFLLGFQSLNAQGWYKFYEQYPSSIAQEIIQLPDHSYIIAGVIDPHVTDQFFLAKIAEDGSVIQVRMDYNLNTVNLGNLTLNPDGELVLLASKMNPTQDLVVLQFNQTLDLKWETVLPSLGYKEEAKDLILDENSNYLIHGVSYTSTGFKPIFAKIDEDGNILWHLLGDDRKESSGLALDDSGNIVSTGRTLADETVFISIHDSNTGAEIDYRLLNTNNQEKESGFEVLAGEGDHLFLVSRYNEYNPITLETFNSKIRIREIDIEGNIIQEKDLSRDIKKSEYVKMIRLPNGDFTYCFRSDENGERFYIQVVHLAGDLETELWSKEYQDISPEMELAYDFITTHDGGYMVSGAILADKYIPLLLKVDANGVDYSNEISGNVFHDLNKNCSYDASENYLGEWMVEIKNTDGVFYRLTDENGHYSIFVDRGEYAVRAVPPSDAWQECPSIPVVFDGYFEENDINPPAQSLFECPVLSSDISIGSIRRCYERNYTVEYCNLGTVDADNVYVEVRIDSQLIVTGATIPITSQNENLLIFDIGHLDYNDCGSFLISVFTPCNVDLGDVHCSTSHIYPDAICSDALAWTGANVKVVGECQDDEVYFEIKNIGQSDMDGSLVFSVIEDEMILMTGTFDLNVGETHPVSLPASGGLYRLEAEQVPDYPGESSPSVIVPGCGGFFDSEYMSWYPMDDDALFYDISCMENVDSYDPNDKQATPAGYSSEHFIEKNTDIEYQIRFQNTGTDVAYNVVIMDPISDVLDISTFRMGVSSHPCEVEIVSVEGKNILKFKFEEINLSAASVDELSSTGFVKFTISQATDLADGTLINNEAHIYFDFNDAIITNVASHRIGSNFIGIAPISNNGGIEEEHILQVTVSPNPMNESAVIVMDGKDGEVAIYMNLYSVDGRLVQRYYFQDNQITITKDDFAEGMYFFDVLTTRGNKHKGKLMIK